MKVYKEIRPDELPVWSPGEERCQQLFEVVRDNWDYVRRFARLYPTRSVAVRSRREAEQAGAWPMLVVFRHRGEEFGIGRGCGMEDVQFPQLLRDLGEHPNNILVTVVLDAKTVGQFAYDIEVGPAGVHLAGGDRPGGVEGEDILGNLGEYRVRLAAESVPELERNYRAARARGVPSPVLLTLDLSDRGARAISRVIRPHEDPKRILSRARKGGRLALLQLAGSPELVANALGNYGQGAARQILAGPPPSGRAWHILVACGRTVTLGFRLPESLATS